MLIQKKSCPRGASGRFRRFICLGMNKLCATRKIRGFILLCTINQKRYYESFHPSFQWLGYRPQQFRRAERKSPAYPFSYFIGHLHGARHQLLCRGLVCVLRLGYRCPAGPEYRRPLRHTFSLLPDQLLRHCIL